MATDFKALQELLGVISQSNIMELELKTEEFELSVSKAPVTITSDPAMTAIPTTPVAAVPTPDPTTPTPVAEPETPSPSPTPVDTKRVAVTSPIVGTFYRASAPDEDPFVEIGDRIKQGNTICIIEAMKIMNEIEAEADGQVVEIVVENGQPVEYGQTLMWILS